MKRNLVIKYDKALLDSLHGESIVLLDNDLENLCKHVAETQQNNKLIFAVVAMPLASLSQIELREEWRTLPLRFELFNIGDYDTFFMKHDMLRMINPQVFLSTDSPTLYTDLRVLSSLGVRCGINLNPDAKIDDDALLDLAAYFFMSQVPHAPIEPFEYIWQHYKSERNDNFDSVYFRDPEQFLIVDENANPEEIANRSDDFAGLRMQNYYDHFMNLDDCSKCPAFKICNRKLQHTLADCKTTMNEVFDYAFIREDMFSNQKNIEHQCQH